MSLFASIAIAAYLAGGCTVGAQPQPVARPVQPTEDMMPSAVLDHQDPGADTSRNPELHRSSAGGFGDVLGDVLGGLFTWRAPSSSFGDSGPAPHYYKGCGGCASDETGGTAGACAVAVAAAIVLRRMRRRAT